MTKHRSQIALSLVTLMLVGVNILLAFQNNQLRASLETSRQFVTDEGYRFTGLNVTRGNKVDIIDFADGKMKTLLLVLNTSCQYCYQQYPYWKKLTHNLDPDVWRVIAVSSEEDFERVKDHLEENGIGNLELALIDATEMRKHRLLFTPMTIVIDSDGTVKRVWSGLRTSGFDL